MGSSSQATTIAETVAAILAIIAVVLRFFTRRITKAGLAADDWSILVGLLSFLVTGCLLLYGVKSDPEGGSMIDRNSPTFDYGPHATYLKVSFIAATLYFSVVTAIKISILLMYRRIFPIDPFRLYSLLIGIVVVVWWIVGTIATIVSCLPIERLWVGPSIGGYCFDFNIFWMAMGAVELVVDTLILLLPIRVILGLRMSKQQKVLLVGIFLLGGFVIVTGVIRVVLGYAPGSQNVAFSRAELWSAVHIGIAIVCACLPTLRPMLNRFTTNVKNLYSSAFSKNRTNNTGESSGEQSAGSKSGGKLETLTLKHVKTGSKGSKASKTNDPHADTAQLTIEEEELGSFIHTEFATIGEPRAGGNAD